MNYYIESTSEIKTKREVIDMHSNKSLPKEWDESVYSLLGISPILSGEKPEITNYQKLVKGEIQQDESGNWTETWLVIDMTDEEKAEQDSNAENLVRNNRDVKLAQTDWRLLKAIETGETLSADWAAYRQALRDITEQEGFPNLEESDWPVAP